MPIAKAPFNSQAFLGVSFFVHPVPALAVGLLILNDHFLKSRFPGTLTGKLSDFAGVFFFPVFLVAIYVLARKILGQRNAWITRWNLLTAILVTDFIFVSINLSPHTRATYEHVMGLLGFPSQVTMDPSDLWALGANIPTFFYGRRFFLTTGAQYKSNS